MSHTGLKKVRKTVRGKKGAVKRSYWVKSQTSNNSKGSGAAHSAKLGAFGGFVTGALGWNRLIGGAKTTYLLQTAAHGVAHELHGKQPGLIRRHAATAAGTFAGNFAGVVAHEGVRYLRGKTSIFGQRGSFEQPK